MTVFTHNNQKTPCKLYSLYKQCCNLTAKKNKVIPIILNNRSKFCAGKWLSLRRNMTQIVTLFRNITIKKKVILTNKVEQLISVIDVITV